MDKDKQILDKLNQIERVGRLNLFWFILLTVIFILYEVLNPMFNNSKLIVLGFAVLIGFIIAGIIIFLLSRNLDPNV